jgi:hypothetical protein
MDYSKLSIDQLAGIIKADWSIQGKGIYFGAKPYLSAMYSMNTINNNYGCDSGRSIVNYFLSNATTWKGETAREIKKELNKRVKGK